MGISRKALELLADSGQALADHASGCDEGYRAQLAEEIAAFLAQQSLYRSPTVMLVATAATSGEYQTKSAIGRRVGVTRERVRQIIKAEGINWSRSNG